MKHLRVEGCIGNTLVMPDKLKEGDMCGKAPATLWMNTEIVDNRLQIDASTDGHLNGRYFLCPDAVDFMIDHLTKMREQFPEECAAPKDAQDG